MATTECAERFFEEVLEPLRPTVVGCLRRLARRFGLTEEEVEDALQDVLLKIWLKPDLVEELIEAVSERARLTCWVRNRVIDIARGRWREKLADAETMAPLAVVHGSQHDDVLAKEQLEMLKVVVAEMTGRAGEALRLEVDSQLTREEHANRFEMGKKMGIEPVSAASHRSRGREKAAKAIGRDLR